MPELLDYLFKGNDVHVVHEHLHSIVLLPKGRWADNLDIIND